MKNEFIWEMIDAQTLRARVAGGWLVRFHSHTGEVAMTLVPDPKHQWEVLVPQEAIAEAKKRLKSLEVDLEDPYRDDSIKAELREEIEHLRRFIRQNT